LTIDNYKNKDEDENENENGNGNGNSLPDEDSELKNSHR
jgi:hypothetical protein